MKFCQECGAQLNDGAKFCVRCGTPCSNVGGQSSGYFPRKYAIEGPMGLKDALNKLASIPNPDMTVRVLMEEYRTILRTEGKYVRLNTHPYGTYYLFLKYYVRNDAVYAIINYQGYAGTFDEDGIVGCTILGGSVTIKAVGTNGYTGKKQQFLFQINGNMVTVTGSGGYNSHTCKRVE